MHRRSRAAATAALTMALGGFAVPAAQAEAVDLPSITINEVESNGGTPGDWIELTNTGATPVDVSGWIIKDNDDARTLAIAPGTTIAPGAFLAVDVDVAGGFGLGAADTARVYLGDGVTLVDSYAWTAHATTTYGRCPDGVGALVTTASSTKGAANDCPTVIPEEPAVEPAELSTTLAINEVESNGDDTDWVEVMNLTAADIDISGWAIKDNDDTRTDVVPAGSVVPAGGLLVIDQQTATYPQGFTFGLGNGDMFRLYDLSGELAAKTTWAAHALVSWSRCDDGVGAWVDAPFSTKGAPNSCSLPIRINEIESSGDATDWVEVTNLGATAVDLGGVTIKDDDDAHAFTVPAGTMLNAGEFAAFDLLDFGLGGADQVRLFDSAGEQLDTYAWAVHAGTTYGRCPDGLGDFATTASSTKGAANACAGMVNALPWPGGSNVSILDEEATFGGDLSGIDFADGTLWAVQNGDGLLYRMSPSGEVTGEWTLTYPGASGIVDAEGVHVAADGSVYVSSERDNSASSVSRPAVLRYGVSGTTGTLVATHEWNLAGDFPGLAANGGLEGITWIPDAWLLAGGLIDSSTGLAYTPATYPGHGDGLFVVAAEGTASAYAYALLADGSFQRVATIATDDVAFGLVADVQFDAERSQLWVVCDEACDGRIAAYSLVDGAFAASALYERPTGMANIANEGFAVADSTLCVGGATPTFYVDDADTDGFSLRSGTLPCVDVVDPALEPGTVTVTGTARVGVPLTADVSGWPEGATLAFQWLVDAQEVAGAVSSTYVPTIAGAHVSVVVTASLEGYSPVSVTSAAVETVAGVLKAGAVAVTGTAQVGKKLTASTSGWPAGATLAYQWRIDGKAVAGATQATWVATPAAKGKRVSVAVTASRAEHASVTKVSASVAVKAGTFKAGSVTITGKVKVGHRLTASTANWPSDVKLAYVWRADGKVLKNTGKYLTPGTWLKGKRLTVTVTASKVGYVTVTKASAATVKVG